jgi:hypothetical protein
MPGIHGGVGRFAARAWRWRVHRRAAVGTSFPHRRGFCFCVFDEEALLPPRRLNSAATTTAHPHAHAGRFGDGSRCCGVDGEPWDGEPRRWSVVAHKPTPASRRTDNPRSPRVLHPSPRHSSASASPASHSRCCHVQLRSPTGCRRVWRLQRRARLVRRGRRPWR